MVFGLEPLLERELFFGRLVIAPDGGNDAGDLSRYPRRPASSSPLP